MSKQAKKVNKHETDAYTKANEPHVIGEPNAGKNEFLPYSMSGPALPEAVSEALLKAAIQMAGIPEAKNSIAANKAASMIALDHSVEPSDERVPPAVVPPLYAHFLIYLLLPKKQRDGLLGDLNEEYPEVYATFGPRLAGIWYWKNVLFSFGPLLVQSVARLVQWYRMAK